MAAMPYTIVLGESEPHVRHVLAHRLRGAGYSLATAADADAVLALAQTVNPSVLVIDAALTLSDGTRLSDGLAQDPATASVPMVLLTSHVSDEPAAGAESSASDSPRRVLVKLVAPTALLRELQEILSPTTSAARDCADVAMKRFAI